MPDMNGIDVAKELRRHQKMAASVENILRAGLEIVSVHRPVVRRETAARPVPED